MCLSLSSFMSLSSQFSSSPSSSFPSPLPLLHSHWLTPLVIPFPFSSRPSYPTPSSAIPPHVLPNPCPCLSTEAVQSGLCWRVQKKIEVNESEVFKSSKSSKDFQDLNLVKIPLFLNAEVQALFDGHLTPNITFIHTCRESTDAIKSGHKRSLTGRSVWNICIGCG